MPFCINHRQNAPDTPVAALGSSVSACQRWHRSSQAQKPPGRSAPWTGRERESVPLEFCTGTALWDRSGYDPLPIRWVLTRDPAGTRHPQAICSTDPTQPAAAIITDGLTRWSLDVTFEEGRVPVGLDTPRQWSDHATRRSTPLLFGLCSLGALCGPAFHPDGPFPVAQAAWDRTATATFHEGLALLSAICGAGGRFPHHLLIQAWFESPARRLSEYRGRSVLALDMDKVKLRGCMNRMGEARWNSSIAAREQNIPALMELVPQPGCTRRANLFVPSSQWL